MVKKGSYRSCLFLDDVLCSHRRSKRFSDSYLVAKYCVKCPHYEQFNRLMDEEDAREGAEVEEFFRTGVMK